MTQLPLDMARSVQKIGTSLVYSEPIELDGTTLVPVAVGGFGFGAGEGQEDDAEEGDGTVSGGGGGGWSAPVGAYVSTTQGVRFEPNVIALIAVGIPFVWVAGRALSLVIKALKR